MSQTGNEKIIQLYKKILLITEKEHDEISSGNIDKLEEYGLIKESMIKKLENMKKNNRLSLNDIRESTEIEKLIKEILLMNKKNSRALISLQNAVMAEISSIQNSKKAHKAYSSQSYMQGL